MQADFFGKKYYSLHFHHFSIFNNYLNGQQGFIEAFGVFVSFREIFSGYSLMLRKQMVFNKLDSNCNQEWMMNKFKIRLSLQKYPAILFWKKIVFLFKILVLINDGWMCMLLGFYITLEFSSAENSILRNNNWERRLI